eukprot:gene18240-biopygen11223
MNVRDPNGRRAIDVATPKYKKEMQDRHRFLKRYELKEGPAEHTSATCIVRLAKDFDNDGRWVALKFMQHKDQFQRELDSRETAERNLGTVLAHEHIAGRDWTQLRVITRQIVEATGHMHSK